jgi:hypothetical protein
MSDQPQHPSAADHPARMPDSADAVRARRRRLLGAAARGAPLLVSLPTQASAAALGSAYRGAINDAANPPVLVSSTGDGWIRVSGRRFVGSYTLASDPGVPPVQYNGQIFKVDGNWYDTSGQLAVPGTGSEQPVFLAVLFATSVTPGSAGATELGAWPRYIGAGQALHLSSWSSLSPSGVPGPNWVVG